MSAPQERAPLRWRVRDWLGFYRHGGHALVTFALCERDGSARRHRVVDAPPAGHPCLCVHTLVQPDGDVITSVGRYTDPAAAPGPHTPRQPVRLDADERDTLAAAWAAHRDKLDDWVGSLRVLRERLLYNARAASLAAGYVGNAWAWRDGARTELSTGWMLAAAGWVLATALPWLALWAAGAYLRHRLRRAVRSVA